MDDDAREARNGEKSPHFWDLNDKDDWQTPPELVQDLQQAVDRIDLDPCAHPETSIGARNWALDKGIDGLERSWNGYKTVFVNPPFSYKTEWLEKIVEEVSTDRPTPRTIILLTPDSTDTKSWWHGYIAPHAQYICFSEGRIAYYEDGVRADSPTFGTAISIFGECPDDLLHTLQQWGHVVRSVPE